MTPDTKNAAEAPSPLPGRRSNLGSVLTVLVLLAAGAGLTAWGISGAPASDPPREPAGVGRATPPVSVDAAVMQRGAMLQQLNCGGCHAVNERVIGPGFLEIARHYRDVPDPQAAITDASLHPSPGFAGYPPGPPQAYLSSGERGAIASWILELSDGAK
jgi:cytochrome c551/c552